MTRISRRRFLGAASRSTVAAAVAGALAYTTRSSGQQAGAFELEPAVTADATAARDALVALVTRPDAADEIGRSYLALHPEEADADALVAALAPPGSAVERARGGALARAMRRRVHDDFARGDIVELDGWQLARSEARLCALWRVVVGALDA